MFRPKPVFLARIPADNAGKVGSRPRWRQPP
jgi:hypothetical protein